jgi:signal transduction histidine kinase/DNA-binding response OmpR family regulator
MIKKSILFLDRLGTKLVFLPGDAEEELKGKKNFLFSLTVTLLMVAVLTVITGWMHLKIMTTSGICLIISYSLTFSVFLIVRRVVHWFLFVGQLFVLLITFITILSLGGIPHSGGLIFVGMATVVYSMAFPTKKMALGLFCVYLVTLLLEGILHPWLTTTPELSPAVNVAFFVINAVWISVFMLFSVFYIFAQRAEIAKAKSERLQELDELKTRLFTNIAHEFRTPLTVISGMTEMIRDNPEELCRERTDLILRNTKNILKLVDQMLNLSRLDAGSMPLHFVQSDMVAFLRFQTGSFSGLFLHRQIRLHFLPDCNELTMDFDPEKMEEIIGNLLSNALKYTPANGDVYLKVNFLPGEGAVIRIRDTGVGIPEEHLSSIFERFYRAGNDPSHHEEGSGIGLTLVHEYVKLMGGEITAKSQPGEGSEFIITLPVTYNAVMQEVIPHEKARMDDEGFSMGRWSFSEEGTNDRPHLLIIEDNQDVIRYLSMILINTFDVNVAVNGEEGIRKALENVPDLILSDVMMPGIDGFELCSKLKQDFRTSHIPIVLLTARADQASRIEGLEHGADAYLTKPFNKNELLACLRNLFIQREKLRIKYSIQPALENNPASGPDEMFMQRIHKILETNFASEQFGIKDLYTALEISRVQLHRKLIALTGQPTSHVIRNYRLAKAKQLLLSTSKTVAEIAYDTGFSDPNYFSRVFALEFGYPPTEIRKGSRNNP